MKFIHAADLHLDSPFAGLTDVPEQIQQPVHQSTLTAFKRIVTAAIQKKVDFVLLVGDNFDTPRHSAAASDFFAQQLSRLNDADIPVVLSYGNHDFVSNTDQVTFPSNVQVLGPKVSTVHLQTSDKETVDISGFSYNQRWLTDDPLGDYPERGGADWSIGTLHGALETGSGDHYAPFKLAELLAKHYDYWALGHVHAPQLLSEDPAVLYSGTSQGRNVNESGPHGYQLVESHNGKLLPHFHAISPVEWNTITVMAAGQSSLADLVVKISTEADKLFTPGDGSSEDLNQNDIRHHPFTVDYQPGLRMVTIKIVGQELPASLQSQINEGALLSRLQTQALEEDQVSWWPVTVQLLTDESNDRARALDAPAWQEAAESVFTDTVLADLSSKLVKDYPALADQLNQPATMQALKQRATDLLRGGGASDED